MNGCEIIVMACKYNMWCVDPFMHQFNKHWGDHVTLVTEASYETSPQCKVLGLPRKFLFKGNCPPKFFSNTLMWALQNTANEFAILLLADYWLYEKVNVDMIHKTLEYMRANRNVLRVDLGDRPRHGQMHSVNDFIIECTSKRDCFLTTSLTPGMWSKKNWLTILGPNWTPWQTESRCNDKFMGGKGAWMKSVWCEPGPIQYTNVQRGRDDKRIVSRRCMIDDVRRFIPPKYSIDFEA